MRQFYKQKLFLYFFIIFALFAIGIALLEKSREQNFKTEALEEKLDSYASIINVSLINRQNNFQHLDSLTGLFPPNIRITLIDNQGAVLYDNALKETSQLESHAQRPEIVNAKTKGKGTNIRVSNSNRQEYLYYAKRFSGYYIRVALPYDIKVQDILKADNAFLYYIIGLFILMILLINYVADRFGKSIKQLRDFTRTDGNSETEFPDDELGEIGARIAENYQQLKENKQTIALEREKLLQHVHSSEEGICFFSADKSVEFYNGLFIQYLNIIVDDSAIKPSVVLTDRSFEKLNDFLSRSEKKENYFETQITKQGKIFVIRVNVFEDHSFEVIVNDITRQEKTRLMKQEMTGNIAHELRTPVTSIRGYLETVLEQSLDKDKERSFLTKAYNQTLVLSELIQDMGLITKMEGASQSFQQEYVSIQKLLESIQNDLEGPLREKGITMELNIANNVIVKGNKNLLYSIFRNLTDNVIRYAGNNVKIIVNSYYEGNFFYFSYSDTGVGIADEQHLNRLFERFYRINEGRTRDTGGSGLGLSIVKNAILFHKGTIDVKNRIGGGLEFLFKLPK
jgi:Signal transduction histidine kinase